MRMARRMGFLALAACLLLVPAASFGAGFALFTGAGARLQHIRKVFAAHGRLAVSLDVVLAEDFFADPGGKQTMAELRNWLKEAARETREPRLLVRASADVSLGELTEIKVAAEEAGFVGVVWGAETAKIEPSSGNR